MTHATDIKPTRPLDICPVRDRCHKYEGYRCGVARSAGDWRGEDETHAGTVGKESEEYFYHDMGSACYAQ